MNSIGNRFISKLYLFKLITVVYFRRSADVCVTSRGPFELEDEEIVNSYLVWGGIALHYADMYHALANQRNLHQFLLTVVKSIFQVYFF